MLSLPIIILVCKTGITKRIVIVMYCKRLRISIAGCRHQALGTQQTRRGSAAATITVISEFSNARFTGFGCRWPMAGNFTVFNQTPKQLLDINTVIVDGVDTFK